MTPRHIVALFAGCVLSTSLASAQEPARADISVGPLAVSGSMFGVNLQVTTRLSPRWSLVGEVDWSRGTDPGDDTYTYTDTGVLGGVRYTFKPTPRVSPFWQVMTGVLNSNAEGSWCFLNRCQEDSFTYNYFAIQPGGGVTVMVTPRFGVRAQADLQFAIEPSEQYVSAFPRAVVGGVISLGRGR